MLESKERIRRGAQVRAVAGDVNGDGRADLLFNKTVGGISNMRSELRLYLANQAGDYPRKPDLVSVRDGWGSSVSLIDVNSDKRKDLLRPHVEMGLTALIGMMLAGKLELNFEVYLSKNGSFEDKPDISLPSKLRIDFNSNQELTGPFPNFTADFNADGIGDLIIGKAGGGSGDNPDRLEIRPGLGQGKYSDTPIWQTDLNGTRYVMPFSIQPLKPPGLLIYFSNIEDCHGDIWVLHNSGRWK